MLYNTEAIVVRSVPYGETHAIVTLLTPAGIVAAMAKGAKKPQSRLAAGVVQCTEGVYSIYQRTGMGTIQQVDIINTRRGIHEQLDLAAHAAYFCELVQSVSEQRPHGDPAIYRLFVGVLDRLISQTETPDLVARVWESKILRVLGVSPDWLHCTRCGRELERVSFYSGLDGGMLCESCSLMLQRSRKDGGILVPPMVPKILNNISRVPFERLGTFTLNQQTKNSLKTILRTQMTQFAGLSPKSLKFLDELDL